MNILDFDFGILGLKWVQHDDSWHVRSLAVQLFSWLNRWHPVSPELCQVTDCEWELYAGTAYLQTSFYCLEADLVYLLQS